MAQANNVSTISPSHNIADPALADALGHADACLKGAGRVQAARLSEPRVRGQDKAHHKKTICETTFQRKGPAYGTCLTCLLSSYGGDDDGGAFPSDDACGDACLRAFLLSSGACLQLLRGPQLRLWSAPPKRKKLSDDDEATTGALDTARLDDIRAAGSRRHPRMRGTRLDEGPCRSPRPR
jgi:hypothetical protein